MANDLEQVIAAFQAISSGMPRKKALTAAWMQGMQDAIICLAQGRNLKSGANVRKKSGPTWVMLSADAGGDGVAAAKCPLDILTLDATAQTVKFRPAGVNQLIPSNFQSALSISNSISYIYIHCATDGKQVNAATFEVSSTPRPPPAATMGAAPAAFNVLVWVIIRETSPAVSFATFKVWGCGGVAATPVEFTRTSKSSPAPGQSPFDIWYAWQAVLG